MRDNKNLKQTEIGRIPNEWEVVTVGEVAEIHDSKRIPLSEMERSKRKGSYPYCGANGIIDYINDYIFDGEFVLLAEDGGDYKRFGNSAYIMKGKFWVNNHAHILKAMEDKVINLFLYYFFNFSDLNFYIVGSTRKKLNQEQMKKILIPLPPIPEQKKITEILSTVDAAIEKVDESIAKIERLKKGLMQELLTKGIGHKEFKNTEIGRIPKEWKIVRLKEVVDINKESRDPNREFPEREFSYIDIDSIENGTGVIKAAKTIIGREAPSRARRVIHYNDVIMSTVRPYLKAFAIVPREYDSQICSTGFAVLTCKERILPSYLLYTLFSNYVISQCNRMMVGGQYPALNNSQVEKIKLPLPSIYEQKKITEILSTVDKRLELLRNKKERLARVKKGLMNDLLSGKKRVRLEA